MKMSNILSIRKFILVVLGIAIFQNTHCQENYLSGYIIPLKGDTIHGLIDYRNWDRNPDKIAFKESIGSDKLIYKPLDIKAFCVSDEKYVSAIVETEISPDLVSGLDEYSDLKFKTDTAFLQTMIKGPKSLYYYNTKAGKVQFYIKNDTAYELLVQKKYYEEKEGRKVMSENKKYIGQLVYYLQGSPEIQSKLNTTEYKKKDIENLFAIYYKDTRTAIGFQKKTEEITKEFGVLGGVTMTSLKFRSTDPYYEYISKADFSKSTNFAVGVFMDLVLPRAQRKWSIYNELMYTSFEVTGKYYNGITYGQVSVNSSLGYSYITMNNLVRYKYKTGNGFIFINGGISDGIFIKEKNYRKIVENISGQTIGTESYAISDTRKYELGGIVGFGAKYKNYSLELRYESATGLRKGGDLSIISSKYFCLLGYNF